MKGKMDNESVPGEVMSMTPAQKKEALKMIQSKMKPKAKKPKKKAKK